MMFIDIRKISVVGANENNSVKEVVDFLRQYPMSEIGIGVSMQKGPQKTPRYEFLKELKKAYPEAVSDVHERNPFDICHRPIRRKEGQIGKNIGGIGLHVNGIGPSSDGRNGWPYRVLHGDIPFGLYDAMNGLSIASMQINFTNYYDLFGGQCIQDIGSTQFENLHDLLLWDLDICLVLPYNKITQDYVKRFYCIARSKGRFKFNVLYDASFGGGKKVRSYKTPAFSDVCQGYAGGLGPENIQAELAKINEAQKKWVPVYIDAEHGVMGEKCIDLNKAARFYEKIQDWQYNMIKQHERL